MRGHLSHHHQGQSLVTVALFAFLLFVTIGLAIDGGLIYAQRRFMQNTADAACLTAANQISLGQSNAVATTAAQSIIIQNLDNNAAGTLTYSAKSDLYSPSIPSTSPTTLAGVNLIKGIEISGPDVRVALRNPGNTTFMRVAGINAYNVSARAHCNAKAGGGGVPFAVARWRGYNDPQDDVLSGLTTSESLPQTYKKGKTVKNMVVRDILQAKTTNDGKCCGYVSGSGSLAWPWGAPSALPGDPDAHTGIYTQASPAASEANPGYETIIAGKDANPNVGDPTFNGPLVLDFRNFIGGPDYYPPLDPSSSLQKFKDLATQYILNGYSGPLPKPGEQVAYYSGLSSGQIEKPFDARYNIGDIITTLIYNGTTYKDESFGVNLATETPPSDYAERDDPTSPSVANSCSIEKSKYIFDGSGYTPASYAFAVIPEDSASSYTSSYKTRAFFSDTGSNFKNSSGRWGTSGSWTQFDGNGLGPINTSAVAGPNFTFQLIQNKNNQSCTSLASGIVTYPDRASGLQAVYLEWEDSNGQRRARYALLNMKNTSASQFFAYFPDTQLYQAIEPGGSLKSQMAIEDESGSSVNSPDFQYDWFDASSSTPTAIGSCSDIAICKGVTVEVAKKGQTYYFSADADSDPAVAVPGEYYVRIQVKKGSVQKWAWYYIKVNPPLSNASSLSKYVYIIGYARFRVTDIKSNYIEGEAVSGLLTTNDEIKYGLTPRLIPWE
jgi:Flp pilus assembly protein TadG